MKRFNKKKFYGVFLLALFIGALQAQPGCPSISAGADQSLPCGTNCTTLKAVPFQTGATTSYSVSQIPYAPPAPYNGGTSVLVHTDDLWSGSVNLPFTFCYFGNSYTRVILGSNGEVSFNTANAGLYNSWSIPGPIPTTLPADISNTILAFWQDLDPTNQGDINWQVHGVAPCRMFIASWNRVALYGDANSVNSSYCSLSDYETAQVVLYETTNVIEIYIQKKDVICDDLLGTYWNGGNAIEGIQNATGTIAYAVPGRNYTQWTSHNDGWRFTPTGASTVAVSWFDGATQISNDSVATVCLNQHQKTYTAQAIYTPCAGGTPVTVTDNVTVTLAGSLIAGIDSVKNISCSGLSDGSAYAHASSANPPFTYGWSNGSNSLSITNLAAGTYIFTATDASGCRIADTVTIVQPTPLTVNVPDVTVINCTGNGTGSLVAFASGGTVPYTYKWDNLQTNDTASNLAAGTYYITVTDTMQCTATASGTLTINVGGNTLVMGNPAVTNVSCNSFSDGSIIANVSGGSPPYGYSWSNLQTGDTATGLAFGNYIVTVTDVGSCTATAAYNITQPPPLAAGTPVIQNIGCNGASSGSITANPTGGTPTYTYAWVQQSNSQAYTGQTISNLIADTYNLTVTDANSCTAIAIYQVTSSPPLIFTTDSTNVTCFGGSDGTATINITSGTQPYQYNWNGSGNTANSTITGLSAGLVTVIVSDADCSALATFNLTQPTAVGVNLVNQTAVSCNGGSDGTITVSGTGGTPGYTYVWSNTLAGATDSLLPAGGVTVTVSDANSCTALQSYIITEPTGMSLTLTEDDAKCFNAADGDAEAHPSGGTPPYTYVWSDGQLEQVASSLVAGNYICTVSDAGGCKVNANTTVNQPTDLVIGAAGNGVKCMGDKNGSITVTANGATPPYNFSATQDGANFVYATNGTIVGLDTGNYTVIVSDSNGCTKTTPANVPNAAPNAFTSYTDSTLCYGPAYNDGAAHISTTTPLNGPYQYSIDGGALQDTGYFSNLSAGPHTITTVNVNGCVDSVPVLVLEPLPIVVQVVPDTVILALGQGQAVQVNYLNATNPTYTWTPSLGLSCIDCPNPVVSAYTPGEYTITVSMINGGATCYGSNTLNVQILPHQPVFIPNSFSPNGDGNNDVFLIYGEGIKVVQLKVFNRWGILVFESENQFGGWDGTYRGLLQDPSVYVYVADITFLDDTTLKKTGSLTLIR
ncbi:MAG: hypothetical protein JWO06_1719 [Bacteroidota bacterium]|nr:hypothetical protein [Bacteroidota bacterium]